MLSFPSSSGRSCPSASTPPPAPRGYPCIVHHVSQHRNASRAGDEQRQSQKNAACSVSLAQLQWGRGPYGRRMPGRGAREDAKRRQSGRITHGRGFSWIGRQHRKQIKLIAAWQMNTTRSASAYESTAALRSAGSNVGMIVVECLSLSRRASESARQLGDERLEAGQAHRMCSIICGYGTGACSRGGLS